MAKIQYELFWRILTENPRSCDEAEGCVNGEYTIFGYLPMTYDSYVGRFVKRYHERPLWVGYCDYPDGADFATAEEMVNAPLYGGKSMREVWPQMEIHAAAGMPVEIWMEQQHIPGIRYDAARDLWYLSQSTEEVRNAP